VQLSNKMQSDVDSNVAGCAAMSTVAMSTVAGVVDVGSADKLVVVVVRLNVGILLRTFNII